MNNNRLKKIEYLCLHTLRHLPDSSSQRKGLLDGIIAALPRDNSVRIEASVMLHHLEQFDVAQQKLRFDGDGHHDGNRGN